MTALQQVSNLADVPMEVEIELDRRILALRDILELDIGSVIRLNRSAGDNISVLVGGSTVGYGEIVIIEDSVGVRITDFHGEE